MSELVVIKPTTNLEYLESQKRKYDALPMRLKMRSNDQCILINGINNEELYNTLKANILYNKSVESDYDLENIDGILSTESVFDKYINKLSLLSSYNNTNSIVESVMLDNKLNVEENNIGIEINIPPITPYFTLSEMNDLIDESDFLEAYRDCYPTGLYNFNYLNTLNKVRELYECYKENPTDTLKEEIISLGWNPSVEPNDKNIKIAHDRIYNDIKERYSMEIIDIKDIIVQEDLDSKLENRCKKSDLYPIFIVISYTNTAFGNVINKLKHTKYSHAAFSLDTNLNKLYTFNSPGFTVESIKDYIEKYDEARIKVLCTFIDHKSYNKIKATLDYYIANKNKTGYSFKNAFNTLTGRVIKSEYALKMICSEFVDQLLKIANVSLSDKSSNQVIPGDFDISKNTNKFYIIYEGLCKDYYRNNKKINKMVSSLLTKEFKNKKKLHLKEAINIMAHKDILLYKAISILESDANSILEDLVDLLTPNSVISEVGLFLKFDNKGNMKLELPMDFQSAYNQSHQLLLEYDKTGNYKGMKEELCKLWYINTRIEKKLNSKFRKNKKELLDIRARVLNDFKKYLTKLLSVESNFSFSNYYKNSDYYDANISIDKNTLKWSGKLLKSILL